MLIRCIDFETTGVPSETEKHAICEAGWCDVTVEDDPDMPGAPVARIGKPNSMLINPGRPMPAEARAVHHISDADVAGAPSPDAACMALNLGAVDYYAAHEADFERKFFGSGPLKWICTYKVALRVWPALDSHKLQYLRYALNLDIDQNLGLPAHRAGPDAYVGAALIAMIIKQNMATFEEMVRWSNGPALLPRINFGKHRGERWENVPTDYLEWIAYKSDLDRDAKANARHHLKLRGAR